MDPRKDILWRVYVVYAFVCLFGLAIIIQVARLQFVEGAYWRAKAESLTTAYKTIDAARGNIYAGDGSLLGTSIPVYELRMDVKAEALTDEVFSRDVDSLAIGLSALFGDKPSVLYRKDLHKARRRGDRYMLIQRNVSYNELKKARALPIFRLGRYKGGLIINERNRRAKPFDKLAARTIGYAIEGLKPVGLEGAYSNYLQGVGGKRLMQKISGNVWMPINDDNEVEPKDGSDIWTTIDINIQDVAENALMKQLAIHGADHGCAVLMEVETGEIKAIANLERDADGNYNEYFNFAIGESMEPGSTFKLMSLIAAMEDGLVDPEDSVDLEHGQKKFFDKVMRDSHEPETNRVTVQRAFEISSNVGISKVITQRYQSRKGDFIKALKRMNLGDPLYLDIPGEAMPLIKDTGNGWSGVTLPWMSIGYELRMTPMQILAFYNAVANKGKLVKPVFVKRITKHGKEVKSMGTQVINPSICSEKTIERARRMLIGVVEQGTATNLKNASYRIAGKTGTAQIANKDYGYMLKSKVSHQASFAGFFPADNPKYSCIVVVNSPTNNVYYANMVAGPVFREIADKVYASRLEMHQEYKGEPVAEKKPAVPVPHVKAVGSSNDIKKIGSLIGARTSRLPETADWVQANLAGSAINFQVSKKIKGIPDVRGMGMRDAVYVLESNGLMVRARGKGVVRKQSLNPGMQFDKGELIIIDLL